MKMISNLFLAFISILTFSCAPGDQDNQNQVIQNKSLSVEEQLNEVNSIEELLAYDDELTTRQLQMMTSDDSRLDIEDADEKASGKNKILIVGDSWALFPCLMGSMATALKSVKATIINDLRCLRTSKAGAEAHEWLGLKHHAKTIEYIKNNPRIKYIYLSLGGNDLMAKWNVNYTAAMEQELFNEVFNNTKNVMNAYVKVRPDIKVVLSGYDFPNFTDSHIINFYKKKHRRMGSPDPKSMNQALIRFSQHMAKVMDHKNLFYIHHLGLSQYFEGVPELGYPANFSLHPDSISPLNSPGDFGGNPDLPSSQNSFMDWLGLIKDTFHVKGALYHEVMKHTYRNVLLGI